MGSSPILQLVKLGVREVPAFPGIIAVQEPVLLAVDRRVPRRRITAEPRLGLARHETTLRSVSPRKHPEGLTNRRSLFASRLFEWAGSYFIPCRGLEADSRKSLRR